MSGATETRPLLQDTAEHEDYQSTSTIVQDEVEELEAPARISRIDLIWVLTGLWSAVFLGALDGTVVATLLTPIGSYFNKSNQASYIGTSYLLSVCCFTPLYGRLSDVLGRKGAMLLGLALFGSGTIGCGLASSMELLILARAVAGMGGGGIMTVSSIAVTDLIPLKQRGLYQGMCNVLYGLGAGIGGPLGGLVNDKFQWQAAFLFQLPILIASTLLVIWKVNIKLPDDVQNTSLREKLRRIDLPGCVTLVGSVGALLLAFSLQSTEELPWSHPTVWGLLLASIVFGTLFIYVERYWSPYPVMPLRLLCSRTPLAVCIANFIGSAAAFSMIYNVPLYFSAVRLDSAAAAGAHLLPHSVALASGSVFAGWQMRRTGKLYWLTLSSAAMSFGACTSVALWSEKTANYHFWFDIAPQGFGMSSLITTTLIAMIATVRKEDMAVAIGITYLFRTTGQVIGVSLSGAILQTVLSNKLHQRIVGPEASSIIEQIRHSTTYISTLEPGLRKIAIDSYADALRVVFICQAALAGLMLISCLPIQEKFLPGTHEEQQAQDRQNRDDDTRSIPPDSP